MKKRKIFRRGLVSDKRGTDLIMPPILIFILSAVLVVGILAFIFKASTGAFVYEQAYAKQVALIIDGAKPEMQVRLDFSKGFEVAEKNEYRGKIVDIEDDKVVVKLRDKGGYSMRYFSDYSVDTYQDNQSKRVILNIGGNPIDYVPGSYDSIRIGGLTAAIVYANENKIENKQCLCSDKCTEYAELIMKYSNKEGVNPLLILSLMIQESDCLQERKSDSGCVGLMQVCSWDICKNDLGLTSSNWEQKLWGEENYDNNIQCGIKIFKKKYKDWGGEVTRLKLEVCKKEGRGCCTTPNILNEYITYTGDKLAIRGYPGWGCSHPNYVDEVTDRYAALSKETGGQYVALR